MNIPFCLNLLKMLRWRWKNIFIGAYNTIETSLLLNIDFPHTSQNCVVLYFLGQDCLSLDIFK